MKNNTTLFALLCVATLAVLPGCWSKKEAKKEKPKTETVTRSKKHSKELIEE